jgi:hypothetical protein
VRLLGRFKLVASKASAINLFLSVFLSFQLPKSTGLLTLRRKERAKL